VAYASLTLPGFTPSRTSPISAHQVVVADQTGRLAAEKLRALLEDARPVIGDEA
jgi:hypothetical protein